MATSWPLKLKKANKNNKLPLTIAIDQEGGRVNRLPSEFTKSVSLYRMSKNTNEDKRIAFYNELLRLAKGK